MRLSRRTIGLAAVALVGAALVWLAVRPSPVPVEVAQATVGALQVTIDEEARTRVRDRYVVTAPIAGRVARIMLEPGDPVARNAVVARMTALPLDPRGRAQAQAQVAGAVDAQRAAAAAVAQAREALAQAGRERARAVELAAPGLASPEERERAELAETLAARDLEAAEFRAQAAQHDVEAARAALIAADAGGSSLVALRSPVTGVVLRIPERSERVVQAGEPLLEVGNCGDLEIVADLLSSDAVKVRPGDLMLVEDWGGDSALTARIRRIEPGGFTKISALGVEEQRVHVVADLGQCPAALGDGYRVEARIVIWEADSALKVPSTALFRDSEGWAVYVVAGGRAAERPVEVGRQNAFETQVLSGLEPGDVVVRHPGDRISEGVRVRQR